MLRLTRGKHVRPGTGRRPTFSLTDFRARRAWPARWPERDAKPASSPRVIARSRS